MKKILLIPWFFGFLSASAQLDTCVLTHTINGIQYKTIVAPLQLKTCMLLTNVNNTSDASKPVSDATQTALNLKTNISDTSAMLANYARTAAITALLSLKAPLASPTFTGTVTLPNGTVTNVMLAGSIDATTKLTGVLPFANGGISGVVAAPATTGTMTVNMTASIITITPTGSCTFNGSGGVAGQTCTFSITTSGVTSFTLTWGTNFRKTGTLATGTTTARFFTVTFICLDSTTWAELSRTAVQS